MLFYTLPPYFQKTLYLIATILATLFTNFPTVTASVCEAYRNTGTHSFICCSLEESKGIYSCGNEELNNSDHINMPFNSFFIKFLEHQFQRKLGDNYNGCVYELLKSLENATKFTKNEHYFNYIIAEIKKE